MNRRESISDEQLFELIRECHPLEESFPAAAAETEGDRVLRQILASDRNETERPRSWRARGRRRMVRTGALSVGAVLVLSGSALAAGNALGVIELGGGDTAETVTSVSTPYRSNGKVYDVTAKPGAAYAYRLVGGRYFQSARELKAGHGECGPDPVNHILVESNRPLSTEELQEILRDESAEHHVRTDTLPPGVVSIGVSCLAGPDLPAASPGTQAQAEAEGWNPEKSREQLRTRIQQPAAGSNAAQANAAQAEAEAEGWTAEKFRKDLGARIQQAIREGHSPEGSKAVDPEPATASQGG